MQRVNAIQCNALFLKSSCLLLVAVAPTCLAKTDRAVQISCHEMSKKQTHKDLKPGFTGWVTVQGGRHYRSTACCSECSKFVISSAACHLLLNVRRLAL